MADEYPWFRMYNEATHDPKLRFIAFNSQIPFVTVFGAWGMVLAMASRSPERGRLLLAEGFPANESYILNELGIPQANDILDGLFSMGLLEQDDEGVIVVSHWEKRQPPSDNSTKRKQEYRARKRQEGNFSPRPSAGTVPTLSRDKVGTVPAPDIDTETDQYTHNAHARVAEFDPPTEPDSLWGDALAEDLEEVVDAAAPENESFAAAYKRLKDEGFEGFPPVKTQRDVKLLPLINTPAVYAWVSVTFHVPNYDQLPYLIKHLGTNPNHDVLRAVWELWRANDYSPGKIIGVLEWYQLRLKDPKWQPRYGQKTRASPKTKTNGVHSVPNGKGPDEFDWDTIGQVM